MGGEAHPMTPHDLAEALAARLRKRGVNFRPEDVEAFAAGLPDDERRLGVKALAERFIQAARAVALHSRGKDSRKALYCGLVCAVVGLWMFGASYLVDLASGISDRVGAVLRGLGLGWAVVGVTVAIIGAAMMPPSFWRSGRAWRELRRRPTGKPRKERPPAAQPPDAAAVKKAP
jgi:hypothetical protein